MGTNFSAQTYLIGLRTLMDRQGVDVRIEAYRDAEQRAKYGDGDVVELQIDSMTLQESGMLREQHGQLRCSLMVLKRNLSGVAVADAFELACDVASSLVDEQPNDAPPVHPGGGLISVIGIEAVALEPPMDQRFVGFVIEYEQQWVLRRDNQIPEPAAPTDLWVGSPPDVGAGNADHYAHLVNSGGGG